MVYVNHVPRVSKPHLPTGTPAGPARHTGGALGGLRILVVHDSAEIAAVLVDVFAAAGARVAVAHEGSDANVLIAWGGHDVVFLDAAVRGATDVLDLITTHRPGLLGRTVVLTGDVRDGEKKAQLRASYPGASFCDSWLVDLVGIAARVTAAPGRRAVA